MITKMPFGQHRNKEFSDIPVKYLDWLIGQDIDSELKTAIESHLSTRAEWLNLDQDD